MKRLLLFLVACADPAALEVRVLIQESGLDDLQVVVRRDEMGPPIFDCTMAFDRDPEGLCPLEGGEGRWSDPEALSFVLYGRPATEVAIDVDGRRSIEGVLEVVTTTVATVALPPNPGERALLELPLVDRTTPRVQCASEEISPTLTEQGSLVVFPNEPTAYVALRLEESGAKGAIYRADYRRDGDTCSITTELATELDCWIRPRSLVGARVGRNVFLAGVCSNSLGPAGTTTLQAVGLSEAGVRNVWVVLDVPNQRVTQPVVANLLIAASNTGAFQVATLVARRMTEVGLFIWSPFTNTSTTFSLPGVSATVQANEILPGPIVFDGDVRDSLIIAGYGGTNGIAWAPGRTNEIVFTPFDDENLEASLRAPALVSGPVPLLADVRAGEVRFTPLMLREEPPRAGASHASSSTGDIGRDLGARVAIGRFGDGKLNAVFTHDGIVHSHPLDGTTPSQFDGWDGRGVGAQHTLLWNMDGTPGVEIVTFDSAYDSMWASTFSGRPFDEWAPLETAKMAGSLSVVLTRLEGSADIDLDVVALAGSYLEVITLGPNSAPPLRDLSWPMPNHDPQATAVFQDVRMNSTDAVPSR